MAQELAAQRRVSPGLLRVLNRAPKEHIEMRNLYRGSKIGAILEILLFVGSPL